MAGEQTGPPSVLITLRPLTTLTANGTVARGWPVFYSPLTTHLGPSGDAPPNVELRMKQ